VDGLSTQYRSPFRTPKAAHEIDHEADKQNKADPAAADDGTAKIKSTAAEKEKQNNYEQ